MLPEEIPKKHKRCFDCKNDGLKRKWKTSETTSYDGITQRLDEAWTDYEELEELDSPCFELAHIPNKHYYSCGKCGFDTQCQETLFAHKKECSPLR